MWVTSSIYTLCGNAEAISSSARSYSTFAGAVGESAADIRRIDSADFQGDEAETYRHKLNRDLPTHLDATSDAWTTVGAALETYAQALHALQWKMSALAAQAGDQGVDHHSASTSGTQSTTDAVNARIQTDTDAANRLHAEHTAAIDACAGAIIRAADRRFEEPPGIWGHLKSSVLGWVRHHADVLRAVSSVLKQVSSISGLLAMIPVLAPVMGTLALVAGAGSVLIDGTLKMATGEGSWSDVLIEGASMVPMAKGMALFKDFRVGAAAAEHVAAARSVGSEARMGAESGVGRVSRSEENGATATRAVDQPRDAVATRTPLDGRTCAGDPIDVVSGEMLLPQTDLELPGILPLILRRTHLSSYRWGRYFGSSWASTLDQRVEVGPGGDACFVAEDGVVLHYPNATAADAGVPVWPTHGPQRWPLRRLTDGGWTVEDADGGVTRRFAATDHRGFSPIADISDRNGNTINFEFDGKGTISAVKHSGGYHVELPTVDGLITGIVVKGAGRRSQVVSFIYRDGNLAQVNDAAGSPLTFEYDCARRIVGWLDRNSVWYRYHYDEQDRCVRTSGRGRVLSYGFSYLPGRTLVTNSLGAVSRYEYNEARQVTRVIDPLGNVTATVWDRFDRPLLRTNPLGATTRFEYDRMGRTLLVELPDGSRKTLLRNDLGLPVVEVDVDGAVWSQSYDARGNLLSVTDPVGAVTTYGYSTTGAVRTVTDPLGDVTVLTTDAAGLPLELVEPDGASTGLLHDEFGRLVRLTEPGGGVIAYDWTPAGRLAGRTGPDGARDCWTWDGEGNLLAHVGPGGARTETQYGAFDLPVARTMPDGGLLRFAYDTELRLTSVLNPAGLHWDYRYDAAGRLTAETDFDGHDRTYTYDRAGQLASVVNSLGDRTEFRFDLSGNLVRRTSAEGSTSFEYDSAGRLLSARSPDSTVEIVRDTLGRITSETVDGRTVAFEFDAAGRTRSRRTPAGMTSAWEFGPTGRPSRLTTTGQSIEFAYDAAGRQTDRLFSAGGLLGQAFDRADRLVSQTMGATARTFRYRVDGALTSVTEPRAGMTRLEMDTSGRVLGVSGPDREESYGYRRDGTVVVNPSAHEMVGCRQDRQGRLVSRSRKRPSNRPDIWHFEYDSSDRMTSARRADQRWTYRYDVFGRRTSKQRITAAGTVLEQTVFSWDGDRLVEQVRTDVTGEVWTTSWEYLPGTWQPVSQLVTRPTGERELYAIVCDTVGRPTELITVDGARVAWRNGHSTLWGAPRPYPGNGSARYDVDCPIRFPGQYADHETGLHYNRHRYYDPETARYTTSDPLGLAPAPDPYSYVPNPTIWADPLGLAPCDPANLQWDEANGGHTIARHVGKSMDYLRSRGIAEASTFPDLATASSQTASNLTQNQGAIRWWLANSKSKVMTITGNLTPGSGLTYLSDMNMTVESRSITTFVRRQPGAPGGIYIHTSYPQP